jgi:hypothetical protein
MVPHLSHTRSPAVSAGASYSKPTTMVQSRRLQRPKRSRRAPMPPAPRQIDSSAHQATYGRQVKKGGYTKDYIQLSRKQGFLDEVANLFSVTARHAASVPLTYQWPKGTTSGAFVFQSADRPHLKWETRAGAPQAWKMAPAPSDATPETLPGDPSHQDFADAENELKLLARRGAGQPYLMAIKLRDEPRTLHLRVYLAKPSKRYSWADLGLVPPEVQALVAKTSQHSALAWSLFRSGGTAPSAKIKDVLSQVNGSRNPASVVEALDSDTGRALAAYLQSPAFGLLFDPTLNHDAWSQAGSLSRRIPINDILEVLEERFPATLQGDAAAETLEVDPDEVKAFREQIDDDNYEVLDSTATVKTRGSAQKAFAEKVKGNYGYRCAITGIVTKSFLIASHIVPWGEDQSIRLDPSNGICLSLLVDCAVEKGYLLIEDDLTIRIDWVKVGKDQTLRSVLKPYVGRKLSPPKNGAPKPEYLRRRRALIAASD